MTPLRHVVPLLTLALAAAGCARFERPPVEITFRDSLLGAGKIVRLENTSNDVLTGIQVEVEAPSGETRTFTLDELAGYETIEIGWKKLGGWEIPAGSSVSVNAEGYLLSAGGTLPDEEADE